MSQTYTAKSRRSASANGRQSHEESAAMFSDAAGAAMEADRAQVDNNVLSEGGVDAEDAGERGRVRLGP